MAKIEIDIARPQPLEIEDTFCQWRDKINYGINYAAEVADKVGDELTNISDKHDKDIHDLHDRIEYDVLAMIIALG